MAKTKEQWATAKALYEGGASFDKMWIESRITRSSITKKANENGWVKGKNKELIDKEINIIQKKSTFSQQEVAFHDSEVARLTKDLEMINNLSRANLSGVAKHIEGGKMQIMEHKLAQDTIDKASQTLGVNPRFANATTITNTNAQQNVAPEKIEIEFIGED